MPVVRITPPVEQPITLDDARLQCQLDEDITDEDDLLESFISAATDYCEGYLCRPLVTQELQYLGKFHKEIELSASLLSIESVQYIAVDGTAKTLLPADYYVDIAASVGRLHLLCSSPSVKPNHPQPVTINFTCGYGAAADVPDSIKQCIRLLVGHWFRNREMTGAVTGSIADAAHSLLNAYRLVNI
jgi:uncharacterized phiE125 gp8 family phage protein